MRNWKLNKLFIISLLAIALQWSAILNAAEVCNHTSKNIPDIKLSLVAEGFNEPVHIAHANDDRLFVVEQEGVIRVIRNHKVLKQPFIDIRDRVSSGGERGLLSIAFHPRYKSNGRFFVNYTNDERGLKTRVSEFRLETDGTINKQKERILLSVDQPYSNHNGGQLAFGPDGYLYIGMGDGGAANDPANNGQNPGTLLGAMLRIDVDKKGANKAFGIPADNPFAGKEKKQPEIWAYGLRNPWRFSFDRLTGELYAADVGQDETEEIDIIEKGKNYGWRIMEGPHCTPDVNPHCSSKGLTPPLYSYGHDKGRSITGGFVYRGKTIKELCGTYIYGDFVSQAIWGLRKQGNKVIAHKTLFDPRSLLRLAIDYFKDDGLLISTFGEDAAGEIYVAAYQSGRIYRIVGR